MDFSINNESFEATSHINAMHQVQLYEQFV
jgi:hypothetical protein